MPRPGFVCFTIVAAFQALVAAAGDVSQDVPVPGGRAAMAQSLGLPSPPDRPRFVAELARLTYPAAESTQTSRAKTANSWRRGRDKAQDPSAVDAVPIPLNVAVWSRAVFRRTTAADEVVAAILSEPKSAHLCYGLAGSDDETLQFFIDHPALLTWLYEDAAAVFAAFGGSLHIRENRVVVPGPAGSAAVWEAVVGEKLDRPEAFVRGLYGQDQGRLAYLYDTIAELDAPRAAFALGLWMKDPTERIARFKALASVNRTAFAQWQPARFPFSRPSFDIATMLTRVRVEPDGSPSFPASRALWSWIFESSEAPADSTRLPARSSEDLRVDAAWLAQAVVSDDADFRNGRLDQISFAQRVFAAPDVAAVADALVAVRAFPRCRMLMLTLERIGVRQASVYAAAARRAQQLSTLDTRRQVVALQQFQGALVLIARLALMRTLDAPACERLVLSLSGVAPNSEGLYAGGVGTWLSRDLSAALVAADVRLESPAGGDDLHGIAPTPQDSLELVLVAALAGSRAGSRVSRGRPVFWEGQAYRVDFVLAEEQRIRRIREKQGGVPIDLGLALADVSKKLTAGRATDVSLAASDLKKAAVDLVPPGPEGATLREILNRAVEELSKGGTRADAQRPAQVAAPLVELSDEMLGDALLNWAYALSIADSDSPVLLTANSMRRHDFGLAIAPRRTRQSAEWALPRARIAVGVPWHVGGSLLGLDVAFSLQSLRRIDSNRVVDAPSLSTNEREAFADTVALLDPLRLRDGDRDAIIEAIGRGRLRVTSLARDAGALGPIGDEIRMDGWRRRALWWTILHEPERIESLFSLTELLFLGGASGVDLDAWGSSAVVSTGCLCTRMAPPNSWRTQLGRPQFGLMAPSVPDLVLHVASTLRELQLPAAITKSILTAAVQDFIDEVRPTDANDWLTLVRAARTASRERIEDYVAVATADGPLVPNAAESVQ